MTRTVVAFTRPRSALDGLRRALASAEPPADTPLDERRRGFETGTSALVLPDDVACEPATGGAVDGTWYVPPGATPEAGAVLHLHGGGYVMGSSKTVGPVTAPLAKALGTRVFAPDYRLAPEQPFPAGVEDTVAAYEWLLELGYDPRRLVISGDSAGGGLSVAGMLALRDRGLPLPAAAVCISPWVDLTATAASIDANAEGDPQVSRDFLERAARHYLAGRDARNPLASPVFADLRGLSPLLVQVGGDEALLDDSHRLADAAEAAGIDVTLEVWEGLMHVWHSFAPRLPEANAAFDAIADWVGKRVGA